MRRDPDSESEGILVRVRVYRGSLERVPSIKEAMKQKGVFHYVLMFYYFSFDVDANLSR